MPTLTDKHGHLLTFTDAARQLGVSRSTLYALVKSSELPYVRVGTFRRISQQAIKDYIRSHTKP